MFADAVNGLPHEVLFNLPKESVVKRIHILNDFM